jgi:hypothetical protein
VTQSAPALDPANGLLYAVADRICRLFAGPDYNKVQAYVAALHAIGAYCPQSIADIANIGRIITFSLAAADLGTQPIDASLPLKLRLRHLILAEKLSANAASAERGMEQRRKYRRDHGGIEDFPVPTLDSTGVVKPQPQPQPAHPEVSSVDQAIVTELGMAEAALVLAEHMRSKDRPDKTNRASDAPREPSILEPPLPATSAAGTESRNASRMAVPQAASGARHPTTHPLAAAVSQTALAAGSIDHTAAAKSARAPRPGPATPPMPTILQKILESPDPTGILHATIRSKMNPPSGSPAAGTVPAAQPKLAPHATAAPVPTRVC